jgi:hypothetical protein
LLDRCVAYAKAHKHPELIDRTIWQASWRSGRNWCRLLGHSTDSTRRTGLDTGLFIMPYQIKDELTGDMRYVEGNALAAAGELTHMRARSFYRLDNVGLYYCKKILGQLDTMFLLECYQHGTFVQVVFKTKTDNIRRYTEVKDDDELERLRWRLSEFQKTPYAS